MLTFVMTIYHLHTHTHLLQQAPLRNHMTVIELAANRSRLLIKHLSDLTMLAVEFITEHSIHFQPDTHAYSQTESTRDTLLHNILHRSLNAMQSRLLYSHVN